MILENPDEPGAPENAIDWSDTPASAAKGEGDTPTGSAPDQPSDKLAMAVERVTWLLEMGQISCAPELRLILSRLASQEDTIRAIADGYQVNHTSKWCRDRARLAARQEGSGLIPTGGEG